MSKTKLQKGDRLPWTNGTGSAVSSGNVVVVSGIVGVAVEDIADGADGNIDVVGVHDLPKATGTAWNQGDALSWDASAGAFTTAAALTPASGDVENCAIAWADAASGDTTGEVHLTPNPNNSQTA